MNDSNNKTLADISRQKNAAKANSLIPAAPKLVPTAVSQPEVIPTLAAEEEGEKLGTAVKQPLPPSNSGSRPERKRSSTSSTIVVNDVINLPVENGKGYNKMIGITEEHHELLRELNFKYRKPMTAILGNLLELLNQAYQKEK